MIRALLALLILAAPAAAGELTPPTVAEFADIQTWIPSRCCWTSNCCMKVPPQALRPIANNEVEVVATKQVLPRTGWSQDGNTWRCTCDHTPEGWIVHDQARTHCVFPVPQSTRRVPGNARKPRQGDG